MIMNNAKEAATGQGRLPGSVEMMPDTGTYVVRCSRDQAELAGLIESGTAEYVFVGAIMPVRSGRELCRLMGDESGQMNYPVMVLSRTGQENQIPAPPPTTRVMASGPLSETLKELLAPEAEEPTIQLRDLQINVARHEVKVKDQIVDLTATEMRLLMLLTQRAGWALSRDQIIEFIRGKGYACTGRSVDVLIVGLRRKLGPVGKRIQTVRGIGYRYRE